LEIYAKPISQEDEDFEGVYKMDKMKCSNFDSCSAALCPLDPHPRRYWYPDTEICSLKAAPQWVKTQRKIQKVHPDPHCYFTQKMLESVARVSGDITGIDCIGYNQTQEYEWIHARENRHKKENQMPQIA